MPSFQPETVAITCSTHYPTWYQGPLRSIHHTDKIRGDLSLEFVEKAIKLGYWVVVIDGFSTKTYQKKLRAFQTTGKFFFLKRKKKNKRALARRQAFYKALSIPEVAAIVLTEPEKVSLLDHIEKLVRPIVANGADIIIPKREEKLFAQTYPTYMYQSEKDGNMLYNEHLHMHGLLPPNERFDMFFGPRVFAVTQKVLTLLHSRIHFPVGPNVLHQEYFNPEEFSDVLYFPIIVALKRKFKVESVSVPFRYPTLQKQNEEIGNRQFFEEKRRLQRISLLIELMHFLSYLERRNHK